jgi:hypothetical protein
MEEENKKKFWKKLIRILSLYYLRVLYIFIVYYGKLCTLVTVVTWVHGSNYETHCCTSMGSTVTREWCDHDDYQSYLTLHVPMLTDASFASTSEV